MPSESSLSNRLCAALRRFPLTLVERVENACAPGCPDICVLHRGTYAWVENKSLSAFPKRWATPVRIPHFKPEQKLWLRRHGEKGGLSWLFVAVGRELFLFSWRDALNIELWPADVWRAKAAWRCTEGEPDWLEWLNVVTGRREMNCERIVKKYLEDNGFDGLVHLDTECGCHLDDFLICGEIQRGCQPAYMHGSAEGEWEMKLKKVIRCPATGGGPPTRCPSCCQECGQCEEAR